VDRGSGTAAIDRSPRDDRTTRLDHFSTEAEPPLNRRREP
jgi:hypothetical protein